MDTGTDVAMKSAGITLVPGDRRAVAGEWLAACSVQLGAGESFFVGAATDDQRLAVGQAVAVCP
jgi:hypothetical protein